MSHQCPVCGHSSISNETEQVHKKYQGHDLLYTSSYSECRECEFVFVTDEQMRDNNRALIEAETNLTKRASASELKAWRRKWSLTQQQAGHLLGLGPTAFSKYENNELRPSAPTERLLYLLTTLDDAVPKLMEQYGDELIKTKSLRIKTKGLTSREPNSPFETGYASPVTPSSSDRYAFALAQAKRSKSPKDIESHEVTF